MVQRTVLHETGQRLLRSKLRLDQREAGEAVAHAVLTNEGGVSPLVGSGARGHSVTTRENLCTVVRCYTRVQSCGMSES
jgi:hypothetical protein